MARTFGPRLLWLTNSQIARYRAAEEATQITLLDENTIELDAAFACPDFTLTLQSPTFGTEPIRQVETVQQGKVCPLSQAAAGDSLMPSASWQQAGDRITVCFDLQRGTQLVRLHR